MAQQVITKLVDDLDGTEATETLRFSVDGRTYDIDLNDKNAAAFRKALDKYVQAGRSASSAGGGRRRRGSSGRGDLDPRAVRVWAAEKGIAVSPRGRIPGDIAEQYRASGGR